MMKQKIQKELLTTDKMQDLFGLQHKFMRWVDYDARLHTDGQSVRLVDWGFFCGLDKLLRADVRAKNYELVAVVALSILAGPYAEKEPGKIIRNPVYARPNTKFLGQTAYAGTLVFRDKKTGKFLPVPKKWFFTGISTCVVPGRTDENFTPMMNLAYLLTKETACHNYETYEKMIRIHFRERGY